MPSRYRLARASSSTRNKRKSWLKTFELHNPASFPIPNQCILKLFSESKSIILVLRMLPDDQIASTRFVLADAQFVIAREHGFESWPKFAKHVESVASASLASSVSDPIAAFIEAACVPRDSMHSSGTLERAEAILAAHPEVASSNIYTAAILGDVVGVRRFLALDARNAIAKGGPYGWDALTYLCFSKYLRLDRARSKGFLAAAKALLDAGASANTGWMEKSHEPHPEWESVIYGAAGIAQHPEVTRLLLERGADPNDGETPYHVPETYDNTILKILVESGKLNDDKLDDVAAAQDRLARFRRNQMAAGAWG